MPNIVVQESVWHLVGHVRPALAALLRAAAGQAVIRLQRQSRRQSVDPPAGAGLAVPKLVLCHSAPDQTSHGNHGCDHKQPPQQSDDSREDESSKDSSENRSDQSCHASIVTLLQEKSSRGVSITSLTALRVIVCRNRRHKRGVALPVPACPLSIVRCFARPDTRQQIVQTPRETLIMAQGGITR